MPTLCEAMLCWAWDTWKQEPVVSLRSPWSGEWERHRNKQNSPSESSAQGKHSGRSQEKTAPEADEWPRRGPRGERWEIPTPPGGGQPGFRLGHKEGRSVKFWGQGLQHRTQMGVCPQWRRVGAGPAEGQHRAARVTWRTEAGAQGVS